ncbi:MAG: hypothetical protein ACI8T1_005462 [Verrucomicrobiales bacterium]
MGAQQNDEGVWTLEEASALSPGMTALVDLRYVDRSGDGVEGIPLPSAKASEGEIAPPEPLSVIGASIAAPDGATFQLTFPLKAGELYRLQSSADTETWTNLLVRNCQS